MALKIAERGCVPPFIVMDVLRAAMKREVTHGDVLHLEVGQPSTGAPEGVLETARRALSEDVLGYTLALGIEPLRARIARHYHDSYGRTVSPESIVVTTGSSSAFLLSFLAAFGPGDRVGVAAPGYPAYRNILTALGVEPVLIPVGPETAFQPTVAVLDALGEKLDGLIVANPSNPTGSMLPPGEVARLAAWCQARDVRFVSDEIYHGITYGRAAETAAGIEDVVVINSFSKYYSMTGWRLGWMVLPAELIRSVECLTQNLFISPPTLSQLGAVAVFDCDDVLQANVARYAQNREVLLDGLPKAGFDRLAPADGAFYLYADVSRYTDNSEAYCRRILDETGIACTPGTDFDPLAGNRFLRFSFAGSTADMAEAVRRLKEWRK
ncbi:MAG: aminotransferase class I/II-fold pyridoxal phosphate-dependent enzyme [Rhodospirillaceae bacterium]|nr:aminotransferase class I/II-fold pyridoxal phosphate-dependent enzyme [Rhodospirillaceae bacterium]